MLGGDQGRQELLLGLHVGRQGRLQLFDAKVPHGPLLLCGAEAFLVPLLLGLEPRAVLRAQGVFIRDHLDFLGAENLLLRRDADLAYC